MPKSKNDKKKTHFALHTKSGRQYNSPHIDKAAQLMQRISADPARHLFQDILDARYQKGRKKSVRDIFEAACEIAATADVTADCPVFFSSTDENRQKAEQYVYENPQADVIHTTPGGWFLERLELFNPEVSPLDYALAMMPWYIAALRFAAESPGNASIAFIDNSLPISTFRMIEIPALMNNQNQQTLNGYPKAQYSYLFSDDFENWIKEIEIAVSAHDLLNSKLPLTQTFQSRASKAVQIDQELKYDLLDFAVKTYVRPLMNAHTPSTP